LAPRERARSGRQISIHSHRAVRVPDADDEARFVTLGLSSLASLLVVVYVYRRPDIVRVISAWKANKRQREAYEEGRR